MARLCALTLWLAGALAWAGPDEFTVQEARLKRQGEDYVLHADINYRLPPAVQEALGNSVPITLVVELKVQRGRRLLWDEAVLKEQLRYRLRYHALSKLYQVEACPLRLRLGAGSEPCRRDSGNHFATLDAAVQALGSIRELNLAPADRFMLGITYKARLRAYLDFEALPLPLRSVAYLKPQWHLDSPWYRWTFAE